MAKEEVTKTEEIKKTTMKVVAKKLTEAKIEVTETTAVKEPKIAAKAAKAAKAGKKSEKGIKETKEKVAKIERQKTSEKDTDEEAVKIKKPIKPTRSKLKRKAKKYRKAAELIEKGKIYKIKEAIDLALKTSTTKFDSTVELHVRLGVDPRQADQNIRDIIVLPEGTGKTVRVAVFAEEDIVKEALKAGADIAGGDEFLTKLDKGEINFDILITMPNMMVKLSKYARILGPKGLMPNPKSGTVTNDISKAISQSKAGKVEYRVDSTGIVHLGVGKVSFGNDKIAKNIDTVFASLKSNKPSSIKAAYVKSITLTTSMGPGIPVSPSEL